MVRPTNRAHLLGVTLVLLAAGACRAPAAPADGSGLLSHDVFFTLRDDSPAARAALVEACHEHLGGLTGITYFSAGTREESLAREGNDTDFHVALHVVFIDRAAHDRYQVAPEHLALIEELTPNLASVRVFDSTVRGGPRRRGLP